jgi:hypothetical protein
VLEPIEQRPSPRASGDDVPIVDVLVAEPVAESTEDLADPDVAQASALLLRYDFAGEGDTVIDRVGESHARVLGGATLDGQGGLQLDGVDDYVDMPNGLLSGQDNVTIVAWLTWSGGACWQRVFDFGSTDAGEGEVGHATTSLFLTPAACPNGVLTFMTERDVEKRTLFGPAPLPNDRQVQVALVYDGEQSEVAIYLDGELQAVDRTDHTMGDLQDVNNWLGRSQWIQDRYLQGRYDELRIYGSALSSDEIAQLHERGPDEL